MKLLILDLDETLIYSVSQPLDREPDFRTDRYYVYKRPGVDDFVRHVSSRFEVGIWTASSSDYATSIVAQLFPPDVSLAFLWSRERCTATFDALAYTRVWIKSLRKIRKRGYELKNVIVVDDTTASLKRDLGNLVPVRPFQGDPGDDELLLLQSYLSQLATAEDIRDIEKRDWRAKVLDLPRLHDS